MKVIEIANHGMANKRQTTQLIIQTKHSTEERTAVSSFRNEVTIQN